MLQLLEQLEGKISESLDTPEPAFFALAFGLENGVPLPQGREILSINQQANERLRRDFLDDFLVDVQRALVSSHEQSLTQKAAALQALEKALPRAFTLPANDRVRVKLELAQAQVISARGDRPRAKGVVEAVRARLIEVAGERDPATLEATNNLAAVQRNLGELPEARANMEQVVAGRTAVLGPDHEETWAAMGNLAVLRIMNREKDAAIAMQRDLTSRYVRKLGSEHPVTLQARSTLATMMVDAGDAAAALPLLKDALAARERVLGR